MLSFLKNKNKNKNDINSLFCLFFHHVKLLFVLLTLHLQILSFTYFQGIIEVTNFLIERLYGNKNMSEITKRFNMKINLAF